MDKSEAHARLDQIERDIAFIKNDMTHRNHYITMEELNIICDRLRESERFRTLNGMLLNGVGK